MGAPRRPNHRSQSFNLKCFTNACSLQNLKTPKNHHKISPKSIPNLSKTFPKSSQSRPRPLPEPSQNPSSKLPCKKIEFLRFFSIFGRSRASQNRAKITKNRKKVLKNPSQKNACFLIQSFLEFSRFSPPKMKPKSVFFHYIFENVDVVKIVLPSKRNCCFSGSEPQKNDHKSVPKRARKKDRKNTSQKSILASILDSKTLPKSIKIPPKSDVKRSLFRDAMQTARKSSQGNGSRRL